MLLNDEPAPFELLEGDPASGVILVCDHASNRIPAALDGLGVPATALSEHIAWDIGAAGVTRHLQQRLGADAVLANYSRLVVDLNRGYRDPSLMPAISDGLLIPGNLGLSESARQVRIDALHVPYHAAIEQLIERQTRDKRLPVFLGIHSFTPNFHRTLRPWHAGVLWDRDPRIALPMLAALRADGKFVIGDNEPYSGHHVADYSIDTHAEARGMAHVGIELRQDLVSDPAEQIRWADRLADVLEDLLADGALHAPLSPLNPVHQDH